MIAIVDYGVGNLFSLKSSFNSIGEEVIVTADKNVILSADKLILPGVGAFGDAVQKLRDTGLFDVVQEFANTGKPLLGKQDVHLVVMRQICMSYRNLRLHLRLNLKLFT